MEVRSLNNPPKTVKMAMESICLLLGEPATDWRSLRQIIVRDNFIPGIIKFSTEDITDSARERLNRDYMSDPSYNFESVNHASKACGPLVKWAIAQVLGCLCLLLLPWLCRGCDVSVVMGFCDVAMVMGVCDITMVGFSYRVLF